MFNLAHYLFYFYISFVELLNILTNFLAGVLNSQVYFEEIFLFKVLDKMIMLAIVIIENLFEALVTFDKRLPLSTSFFKFILNRHSNMVVLLIYGDTVEAKIFLSTVFASFLLTEKNLDVSSSTGAYDIVVSYPLDQN